MKSLLSALLVLGITVGVSAVRQTDDTAADKLKKVETTATTMSDGLAESDSMAAEPDSEVHLIAAKLDKLKRRYAEASASEKTILFVQLADLDRQFARAEANLRSWQSASAGGAPITAIHD